MDRKLKQCEACQLLCFIILIILVSYGFNIGLNAVRNLGVDSVCLEAESKNIELEKCKL